MSIKGQKFTGWPPTPLPAAWMNRKMAVNSVCAHPRRNALEQIEPSPKKKQNQSKRVQLKVIPMKYLAGFHWIGDDEAVAVEILPENIVSQLPPIMAKKKHNME
ncbi:unnamed protein product [Leptidea sinapis]|uniref:Uncharacterized protein n=1 Tax=Leptidea sinapis TaxID=189913 RepID=A0A5E4PLE9_9NEOP|nr:unnamed protein product [Leptidea sinapis]